MAGKVGKVCRREDLDRMPCQIIIWVLESFENGHVGLSVIVENVPEDGGQLMSMDRWQSNVDIGDYGICISHT